jgi:hypothetical protein
LNPENLKMTSNYNVMHTRAWRRKKGKGSEIIFKDFLLFGEGAPLPPPQPKPKPHLALYHLLFCRNTCPLSKKSVFLGIKKSILFKI